MQHQSQALELLTSQTQQFFQLYADGTGVASGQRLRLEGKLQFAVELGLISVEQQGQMLEQSYRKAFPDSPLDEVVSAGFKHGELPSLMPRAPVYPTT